MKLSPIVLLLLIPVLALALENGTALKNDTLRVEPYADAQMSGTMKRNDPLDILEKKGGWLKVKAGANAGWVRILSVKRGAAGRSNEAGGVIDLASGRSGTGQVVATTGVRGLSEEELKSAKFSETEVAQLEGAGISIEQAKEFAAAGDLQARNLEYLPKPASAQEESK